MCRVPRLSLFARTVYRSSKYVKRNASTRHLWPGSQAFLNIEGVSQFNEENEVDRLALSFLNDAVDEQPISSYKLRSGNKNLGQKNNPDEEDDDKSEQTYELANDVENLVVDGDAPSIDYLIYHCVKEVAELENSLGFNIKQSLDEFAFNEVKDVLAKTGLSVTSFDQANNNQNHSNITVKGSYKNFTPKLKEFTPKGEGPRGLSNECLPTRKELDQLDSQDYLNTVHDKEKHPKLSKSRDEISTYKPFRTIEVPVRKPEKTEIIAEEAKEPKQYDLTTNELSDEELNQQTVLDETKSRILMRYALLKALYVLESGGNHCKAKIIFRNPKKP
ncbi:hypothetical protein ACLKA6_006492 [Drosophila palustris]